MDIEKIRRSDADFLKLAKIAFVEWAGFWKENSWAIPVLGLERDSIFLEEIESAERALLIDDDAGLYFRNGASWEYIASLPMFFVQSIDQETVLKRLLRVAQERKDKLVNTRAKIRELQAEIASLEQTVAELEQATEKGSPLNLSKLL